MVMIPLYLLGASEVALNIYVAFAALQAVLIHCNTSIPFGPLKYIIVTPQFHHWHHSSEKPAIDTNYSAHTILFDWLFNTMHLPGKHGLLTMAQPKNFLRHFGAKSFIPLECF